MNGKKWMKKAVAMIGAFVICVLGMEGSGLTVKAAGTTPGRLYLMPTDSPEGDSVSDMQSTVSEFEEVKSENDGTVVGYKGKWKLMMGPDDVVAGDALADPQFMYDGRFPVGWMTSTEGTDVRNIDWNSTTTFQIDLSEIPVENIEPIPNSAIGGYNISLFGIYKPVVKVNFSNSKSAVFESDDEENLSQYYVGDRGEDGSGNPIDTYNIVPISSDTFHLGEDYQFIGWKEELEVESKHYNTSSITEGFEIQSAPTFQSIEERYLYAQWYKYNNLSVIFNENGGEYAGEENPGELNVKDSNEQQRTFSFEASSVIPKRDGYTFGGWKYVDETGEEKIASAGEKITIKTEESAIELMAVWNKITNIGGSGTYYLLAGANNQYTLGEGSWTVDSDGYTYSGGTKFYVPEDGEYTFTVTQ